MRITLVSLAAAVVASVVAPAAMATTNPTAVVDLKCVNRTAVATFTYTGFSPQWNLTAQQELSGAVSASSTHSFSGPGSSDTLSAPLPAGTGPFTVRASTEVYGGAGRLKASGKAEVTCSFRQPPPPPPPVTINPSARFWGPCGDPFYRAVLNNRRSDRAVKFAINYKPFGEPRRTIVRTVRAHRLVWTGLFDAAGGTSMTIKWVRPGTDKLLAFRRAAPNRVYPPCPPGVPVIG